MKKKGPKPGHRKPRYAVAMMAPDGEPIVTGWLAYKWKIMAHARNLEDILGWKALYLVKAMPKPETPVDTVSRPPDSSS